MSDEQNWRRVFEELGSLNKGQENLTRHVEAVSHKVDRVESKMVERIRDVEKDLSTHKEKTDAHGQGAVNSWTKTFFTAAGWAVALAGFIFTLVRGGAHVFSMTPRSVVEAIGR